MGYGLSFAPLVPLWLLIALGVLALAAAAASLIGRTRGAYLRTAALALLTLAVANPQLTREDRERLRSVVAVVVDESASQKLADRAAQTEAARAALEERLKAIPDIDVREIRAGGGTASDGTELFAALQAGLADVPPERVAGAIMITDGVVHDIPGNVEGLGFSAPLHALITGREDERDRRVALGKTPRFGIVGQTQQVTFRVIQNGFTDSAPVPVTVRRDGEEIDTLNAVPGQEVALDVSIAHAGPNIVEIEAATAEGEITAANNRAVLPIEGVREKLRVLLVSGEPHTGERTWRNLLKADASVDLVHFTILRPPEKQDGTPLAELALIAFPTRELFQTKIDEFDLIIFDRYSRQGILPIVYFDNIARYVREGGAVLVAAGPDYAGAGSLYETPLAAVLPAEPTGGVIERAFHAKLTADGRKHPVTRGLPGAESDPPHWSRFFRVVNSTTRGGNTVMSGADDQPLVVLAREEKGRVAVVLSDHVWLWARGFEGGGPHQDLLRRLAHWLMKEPDLEEEALRLEARGGSLTIERQTMADTAQPVTLTLPSGASRQVTLAQAEPGLWRATFEAEEIGLYRATEGALTALANVGPANPREFLEVGSTTARLEPLAAATGGTSRRISAEGSVEVPRVVTIGSGSRFAGSDWIGVREPDVSVVRGIGIFPLIAGVLGLILMLGALAATWAREGR